jgi:hypothetical protein
MIGFVVVVLILMANNGDLKSTAGRRIHFLSVR